MAPLMIIMSIVGLIPVVRLANYGLQVYIVGLAILSVKAVHRIGWGEATGLLRHLYAVGAAGHMWCPGDLLISVPQGER